MGKELAIFTEQISEYKKKNYNVLLPSETIQEIGAFQKPVLEIVRISPYPKDGDVYVTAGDSEKINDNTDLALSKVGHEKIAYAAGIVWDYRNSGRTDDGSDPYMCSYKAVGAVKKEDGSWRVVVGEKEINIKVIEDELVEQYTKKAKNLKDNDGKPYSEKRQKEYVDFCVRRDVLQKRKHKLALAQTGAMLRTIRSLLALKSTYKKTELEKPFVVPKISFNFDLSDPVVKHALIEEGVRATGLLFGQDRDATLMGLINGGEVLDVPHEEVVESDTEKNLEEKSEDAMSHHKADFLAADKNGQIGVLKAMMKRKGYDAGKLKKSLDEFADEHRVLFYERLEKMDDIGELPFD
ncbi:MAG: hypothetical protein AB1401_00780 [Thermodesulfobacteriota bacterium]